MSNLGCEQLRLQLPSGDTSVETNTESIRISLTNVLDHFYFWRVFFRDYKYEKNRKNYMFFSDQDLLKVFFQKMSPRIRISWISPSAESLVNGELRALMSSGPNRQDPQEAEPAERHRWTCRAHQVRGTGASRDQQGT